MREKKFIHILIALLLLSCFAIGQTSQPYSVRTLVIDAGHGGKDPGAVGKISYEKNITLSLALKVGSLIAANCPDVKVIYTRKTDEFIELHRRADIANKAKADLFISIHVNASVNSEAYGTDTWVMGLAKNEANLNVAKRENDVISLESDASQYQGMSANDNEAIILHKLQQGVFSDNSLALAGMVQNHLQAIGRKDRSVHQAPFLVLWKTAMPSVLIETGFISNPEEELWINQEENRDEMAYSIYLAFLDYKKYIENRSNGSIQQTTKTQSTNTGTTSSTTKPSTTTTHSTTTTTRTSTSTTTTKTQTTTKTSTTTQSTTKPTTEQTKTTVSNPEIYYGIQIGAGKEKNALTPSNFKGLSNVYYIEEDGLYKYYYGRTTTYKEIASILPTVKEKFPSAYIIARDKNNKKLQLTEARQKTN